MGISQLLPFLEKSTRPCHVSEFRGRTVAVDTYCWLHRGARSCALQLVKGDETDQYVIYCMKYVNLLLAYDIKPIMVFDGRYLPAKSKTEAKRKEVKRQARNQGMELFRLGQTSEAYKYFCQCIEIIPEMALALMKACRKIQVDCIVAPYEADAQLTFFNQRGIAECVISEDSDLLPFGCKKVLYKMDLTGSGQLVEADKLHLSMKIRREQYSFDKFRHMCILSGCDYLDSLPGIGLKKAMKFITMTAETNPAIFLDKLPRYVNMKRLTMTPEYKHDFLVADATFLHQLVFDPFKKMLVPLNPQPSDPYYCKNAGSHFEDAYQVALGNLDPLTMRRLDNWNPNDSIISEYSIWSPNFKNRVVKLEPAGIKPKGYKSKNLDSKAIDIINFQHDQQTEKEIEFYKSASVTTVAEKDYDQPPKTESEISPVLGNNPFVKKISRFEVTQTNCEQKVISRFFSNVVGAQQLKTEFKSSSSSSFLSLPSEDDEDFSNTLPELKREGSPDGAYESDNLSLQTQPGDFESQMECQTDDDMADLPLIECECILEVDDEEIQPVSEVTLASVENLPTETNRKRKLEPEPQKKAKGAKKQLTIRDMFKKMKML